MGEDARGFEEHRLDALRRDIAERLRVVCESMPPSEFVELVDRIARLQRKFERRASSDLFGLSGPPKKDIEDHPR